VWCIIFGTNPVENDSLRRKSSGFLTDQYMVQPASEILSTFATHSYYTNWIETCQVGVRDGLHVLETLVKVFNIKAMKRFKSDK
jgi:hypothetical protein